MFLCRGIQVALMMLHLQFGCSNGCQELKGIGDTMYDYYTELVLDNVHVPFSGHVETVTPIIADTFDLMETPIQARLPIYYGGGVFSVLSSYDENALEFFGRIDKSDARRRCQTSNYNNTYNYNGTNNNTELFEIHRNVALWYALYFGLRYHYPSSVGATFGDRIESLGLESDICDDDKYYLSHCYDTSTPWGLSYVIATEYYQYSLNDGWNSDGSYSRIVNKIPYQDFRDESKKKYTPQNNPWELTKLNHWQPLLESDQLGFLFYQEHVTPHIGYTGKSVVFTNNEICQRSKEFKRNIAQASDYDYNNEILLLLNRMSNLTETSKMEIEYFDAKSNLGRLVDQFRSAFTPNINPTSLEFWVSEMSYLLNTYETVITAWKEKVDFDRVRPTSIIHELLGEQDITTYGGVTADGESIGVTTFPANNFEGYIRTMPHSEYPSGSACICTSWANAMIEVFGMDNVTTVLPNGLQVSFAAFSSEKEPLSTPSNNITIHYDSFSAVAHRCAQTRLEAGLHFTASVPDAIQLCQNIGTKVAKSMRSLANGVRPDYIVDIQDFSLNTRDCYPKKSKTDTKTKSKSNSNSHSSSHSNSASQSTSQD